MFVQLGRDGGVRSRSEPWEFFVLSVSTWISESFHVDLLGKPRHMKNSCTRARHRIVAGVDPVRGITGSVNPSKTKD